MGHHPNTDPWSVEPPKTGGQIQREIARSHGESIHELRESVVQLQTTSIITSEDIGRINRRLDELEELVGKLLEM